MKQLKRILFYLFVLTVCLIVISPFLMLILYSIRSSSDIFALDAQLIPKKPSLEAYYNALFDYKVGGYTFGDWAFNSLLVSGVATACAIFFAAMCGYGLARFNFHGKPVLWFIIVLTQSLPWVVLVIPYFMLFAKFGLINNRISLSMTYMAIFVPVSTWLFTGFFNNISKEIEDAAKIDGCNHWGVFFRIILPLSTSGIAAISLFAFVIGWGDFLISSVFMKSAHNWTLPVGIMSFRGEVSIQWAEIMAISSVITLPIVVLFIYLQKYLIHLMAGGVKE